MSNGRTDRGANAGLNSLEALEARQLLAADLPDGGSWLRWGNTNIAVQQNSYIITFGGQQPADQAVEMARAVGQRLGVDVSNVRSIARGQYATFETTSAISLGLARRVSEAMGFVASIGPNRLYSVQRVPNDPQFQQQYFLQNTGQFVNTLGIGTAGADIHATEAWDVTIGSRANVVAVIDTGIDIQHPDLIPNLWVNPGEVPGNGIDDDGNGFVDDVHGYDFGENDGNPDDFQGHGTAVAGTIGAAGNNNLGVTGVNWNVSLMGLKIANAQGGLTTAAIVAAHDYATMMIGRGTNIVASNNSYRAFAPEFFGDPENVFNEERIAIERFIAAGATFVAAAGNDSADNDNPNRAFPASFDIPGVISVAASDSRDQLAAFSNWGVETVDIAAPGVQTLTTQDGGGYTYISGTSFSSPITAGAVALLKTVKPNATAVEIREALINSADQLPAFQGRVRSGGRLNIARAIQVIQIDGPVVRSVSPGPVSSQFFPGTSTPLNTVSMTFSKDIDAASLSTSSMAVLGAGTDGLFGTSDDFTVPITSVVRSSGNPRLVTATLNLSGFTPARLPIGNYRLTVLSTGVRDVSGNYLNGSSTPGSDHVYNFRIAAPTGDNEPNDSVTEATTVNFDANGSASFLGVTLGNGLFGPLDVDIYKVVMPRGGQIYAEVTAQRLPAGSSLDGVLRVFDANGNEIASNDQFFGNDPAVDVFVQTGGTYFVGVSGFGNANYNPNTPGSGNTQVTGVYNLRVDTRLATDDTVTTVGFEPTVPLPPGTDVFTNFDAPSGPTTNIPPNAPSQTRGITSAFIDTTDSREILDVNVRLRLSHDFVGDLIISLIAPNGREIILSNRRGGPGHDTSTQFVFHNVLFDDEASASIQTAPTPFTGALRPESLNLSGQTNALGLLDGQRQGGRWTLKIEDTTSLNVGQLLNWALDITYQNNIFGPFEANDTLTTSKNLAEINGSGTATRDAFIGDGGFGNLDRDIFSFQADAGATLTASVTPNGLLNAAIRVFDANGTQFLISNPSDSASARIENFVFTNSGVYYIAVSESSNVAYDPTVVGSGTNAATTGDYTLSVTVAPGVSDPGQVYDGSVIDVGISAIGGFGAGGTTSTAIRYNGIELLGNGFFGAVASGLGFANASGSNNTLPFSLTNESDPLNNRVTARGQLRNGLKIERSISFGVNDHFFAVDVFLTNTGSTSLRTVSWMEGLNPDPGVGLAEGDRTTINDVANGTRLATASYINNQFGQGLTIGIGAAQSESRARATWIASGTTPRDSSVVVGAPQIDPNGASADDQMVLTFDLGNISAGATSSFRYFIFAGSTPAEVAAMYAALNAGTGTGHLAANSASPASETLSDGSTAPQLPYKIYYPEGATGNQIFTYIPISNLNSQPVRLVAIARYELGGRDQIIGEQILQPNTRGGFTLIEDGQNAIVRQPTAEMPWVQYAVEIRSDKPLAATFSHYDQNLVSGPDNFKAAVGESFTSVTNTTWTFGQVQRGGGNTDFVTWYNTTSTDSKVDVFFYPQGGGQAYQLTLTQPAFRRGGISVNDALVQRLGFNNDPQIPLPEGVYGVVVSSPVQIVASTSHYNGGQGVAEGTIGNTGTGATTGVIPEGQIGQNGTSEQIAILNQGSSSSTITFTFLFDNGSAYRHAVTVGARSNAVVEVSELPNFQAGRPYSVLYEATNPVSISARSNAFNGQLASSTATRAYSLWSFGEGFRPGDADDPNHPGVSEHLRLYNPTNAEVTVEISIAYFTTGGETFRRTLPARSIQEFNVHDFVTGARRANNNWYSLTVKAASPIVAYMAHYDRVFPGAFGSAGTPLGRSAIIS